jgi:hypothetical protein
MNGGNAIRGGTMAPSLRRSPPWLVPLSFRWQRRRAVPGGLAGGSRPSTERRRLTPSGKERSPAIRKGGPGRCQLISRQNRENENGQSGEIWRCYVEMPPGAGLDWVPGRARLRPSLGDTAVRNSESVRRAAAFPIRNYRFVWKEFGILPRQGRKAHQPEALARSSLTLRVGVVRNFLAGVIFSGKRAGRGSWRTVAGRQ